MPGRARLARPIEQDVRALFVRMYDQLSRPNINRDELRDCTDQIATITMAQLAPDIWRTSGEFASAKLTPSEGRIVEMLHARLGRGVTQGTLLEVSAFNRGVDLPEFKIVQVFVLKIRRKFRAAKIPYRIETVWGEGYRMVRYDARTDADCSHSGHG